MLTSAFSWLFNTLNSSAINWPRVLIAGTLFEYLFKNTLRVLQYRVQCKPTRPKEAEALVDDATFAKSQSYQRARLVVAMASSTVEVAVTLWFLSTSFYTRVWYFWSTKLASSAWFGERTVGSLTCITSIIISSVVGIPTDLISTFGVEQKFGFNNQTFKLWVTDAVKELLVMTPLTYGVMWVIQAVIDRFDTKFLPYMLGVMLVFLVAAQTIFPAVIMPLFNKFEPLEKGELRTAIEDLAASQKFPLTKLYVIDGSKRSSHSNAFFIGLPWYKQIVLYDTLIKEDTVEEVVAVLAHELGHWKHNHILVQIAMSMTQLSVLLSSVIPFLNNHHFYRSVGFAPGDLPTMGALTYYTTVITPLTTVLTFVSNYFIRTMEYDADRFATRLGKGPNLSSALTKLSQSNLGAVEANGLYSTYTYSHPLTTERLHAIKEEIKKIE